MYALDSDKAVVLFSGGQDSAIALAWALQRFDWVETIGFDYGQRHAVELGARTALRRELTRDFSAFAARLGPDTLVDLGGLGRLSETALTRDAEIAVAENGLPTTFVPGRNLAFLVFAAALAYRRGAGALVAGMCQVDYSGYPDCREEALRAQIEAIRLGMDAAFRLETPVMHLSKAESWRLAEKIGGRRLVDLINEHSHSCYRGVRATRHEWGYGCGDCPACDLRAKGWAAYVADEGGETATGKAK
ncbi:7-cyano-7-deazaguanine synthase QueC [Amphiplicatus metriothermophilus]|uniref:7-cyano-7-deazaguanine synthase n=1 Tax=Amphiplicatus metriothermophilus TaxID=1519374 RepID=A0A239PP86_9PROT|nr:7-cyano-7-deazaguanine synthase QueC [Amphiplicatus metriothermophilus]MBB5518724.1 7-cyano-7-deazaguanine synthase [Amphiplicatus metriothermophilus]SNT72119.1 preQ(0) biosynthesis protein QueC [Amphiplicatus metriothermophilus]